MVLNIQNIVLKTPPFFTQVLSAGAEGLPRIIGGTDLRPHLNSSRKVDEWFAEERQQEEERLAEDRVAEEMFA